MKQMIEAGAAELFHFEDQLSSAKKMSSSGGKSFGSSQEAIKLIAARLARRCCGVPTVLVEKNRC